MKVYFDGVPFFDRRLLKKVFVFAAEFLGQPKNIELNLAFLSGEEIKKINGQQRGVDEQTDVLSFPCLALKPFQKITQNSAVDSNPFSKNIMLGDILICPAVTRKQAEEYGHGYKRELAYEALHGFLHLNGFDHIEETDERQMTETAEKILSKLNIKR